MTPRIPTKPDLAAGVREALAAMDDDTQLLEPIRPGTKVPDEVWQAIGEIEQREPRVVDVAAAILDRLGDGATVTGLKLQKLAYYVQVWTRAWFDTDAFDAPILAYKHGPCCPQLENDYGKKGALRIQQDLFAVDRKDMTRVPPHVLRVVESVVETYGRMTDSELEAQTHREEPWIRAWKGLNVSGDMIRPEHYGPYYRELYHSRRGPI